MFWALALPGFQVAGVQAAGPAGIQAFVRTDDAVEKPLGGLSGDVTRGKAVVLDRRRGNCLICHALPAVDEPFQGEIGPDLKGVGSRLTAGQIRLRLIDQSVLNPKTVMPPYYRVAGLHDVAPAYAGKPALDAQEIEDVVAYLTTLKD